MPASAGSASRRRALPGSTRARSAFRCSSGSIGIPTCPNVPTAISLATTEAQRQALALVFARQEYGRPFFAPPGVPAARVAALRRAFDATMKDKDFLAEADNLKLEIEPMTGEVLQGMVAKLAATPPELVQDVRDALARAGKKN